MSCIYTALVVDHHDPVRAGRVKVMCPAVYGSSKSVWVPTLVPPDTASTYREGDVVEIILKDDDPQYPLVLGRRLPYNGEGVPDEFRGFSTGPYKDALKDKTEHEADAYDNADHKKGHDHGKGEYWNPYTRGMFWKLGAKLYVSEEPGKQSTTLQDRLGQQLVFEGDPVNPVDPNEETRVGGEYTVSDLDPGSETGQAGWRAVTRLKGMHGNLLEMKVGNEDREEELTLMMADTSGSHSGSIKFSNTLLDYNNTLSRVSGGFSQTLEQVANSDSPSVNKTRIFDELGNQIEVHSDPIDHWIEVKHKLGHHIKLHMDGKITLVSANNLETVTLDEATGIKVFSTAGIELESEAGIKMSAGAAGVDISTSDGGPISIEAEGKMELDGSTIEVGGTDPVVKDGDSVSVDSGTHVGTVTASSTKVTVG